MNDRILSLLGLCRRAGKLVIGADPCVESITKKKSRLIVFASDFSQNSKKGVLECARKNDIMTVTLNRSKDEISFAVGRLCGAASIEDDGFAKKLAALADNEQTKRGELYDKVQG